MLLMLSVLEQYTRCAWAGGTFFPVVVLCQFLVLAGNRFWFYILMYLCTGFRRLPPIGDDPADNRMSRQGMISSEV
jgi:hypothetical protein